MMSHRDRAAFNPPEPRDSGNERSSSGRGRSGDDGDVSADRPARSGRERPANARGGLDLNPEDVERYLEQRNRAATTNRTPRPERTMPGRPTESGRARSPSRGSHSPSGALPATPGATDVRATWDEEPSWANDEIVDAPREQISRQRQPSRRARRPTGAGAATRPSVHVPHVTVPRFIAEGVLVRDRSAVVLVGIAVFSAALMAAILNNLTGRLDPAISIHIDAAGFPDRWASPTALWRIPLLAAMSTLINLAIAWFVAPIDRFAARVLLGGSVIVHLLAWVAIADFL